MTVYKYSFEVMMARPLKLPGQQSLFAADTRDRWFRPDDVPSGDGQRLTGYTLLFAIFPPEDEAQRFHRVATTLRSTHGLSGRQLLQQRLHLTLIKVKSYAPDDMIPQDHVDAALLAGSHVKRGSFPIVFDRAASHPQSHAYVMACDELSNKRVATLRQTLATELKRASGSGQQQTLTPHMTMLYDSRRHVKEHPITPLTWTATRFALILRHAGLTHHQWIREWQLGAATG